MGGGQRRLRSGLRGEAARHAPPLAPAVGVGGPGRAAAAAPRPPLSPPPSLCQARGCGALRSRWRRAVLGRGAAPRTPRPPQPGRGRGLAMRRQRRPWLPARARSWGGGAGPGRAPRGGGAATCPCSRRRRHRPAPAPAAPPPVPPSLGVAGAAAGPGLVPPGSCHRCGPAHRGSEPRARCLRLSLSRCPLCACLCSRCRLGRGPGPPLLLPPVWKVPFIYCLFVQVARAPPGRTRSCQVAPPHPSGRVCRRGRALGCFPGALQHSLEGAAWLSCDRLGQTLAKLPNGSPWCQIHSNLLWSSQGTDEFLHYFVTVEK